MQCSCENYMHCTPQYKKSYTYLQPMSTYLRLHRTDCWCMHVAVWSMATGLITGLPPLLQPKDIESVKRMADGKKKPVQRVGRPANAQPGTPLLLQQ